MPGPMQARHLVDMHVCKVPPGFPSPITIPTMPPNVMVNYLPAGRAFVDMALSGVIPPAIPAPVPHPFVKGSTSVLINYMPALRMGDLCALGGNIVIGSPNVMTGG